MSLSCVNDRSTRRPQGACGGPPNDVGGERLERLSGTPLGFRNLAHRIAISMFEAGGVRRLLHARLR